MRIALALVLTACGSSSTPGTGTDASGSHDGSSAPIVDAAGGVGEPAELAGITLAHNTVRAGIATTPALPALAWSPQLAASAHAYLARCIDADGDGLVDHNPNRSDGFPDYVGENIYASSGTASGDAAVHAWASEGAHFHIATNTCDGGAVCGHYTQLVWRNTTKVGCALVHCPGLTYPSTILCDYEPGGNFNGQPPY